MQRFIHTLLIFTLITLNTNTIISQTISQADYAQDSLRSAHDTMDSLKSMGIPFYEGNSVVLLPSGHEKFKDMFCAIRQARRFIHLEYFNYRNDTIGWALFGLLGEKARQGVEVKVMCDDFGNRSNDHPLKRHHLDSIRGMGIQIEIFDRMKFPYFNHALHRDHMKIVVVDGEIAYSGGMNVADYYIHGKPEIGSWHDMHMRMEGPVVAEYERIFRSMWHKQTGQQLDSLKYASRGVDVHDIYHDLKPDSSSDVMHKTLGVVHRRPGKDSKLMSKAYVAAIDAARHHIQIVNPYPTGVYSVRSALYRALQRGVRIEFMVSAKSDVPITPDVVGIQMKRLMNRGCEVYYYEEGFHHSKFMIVDDQFCTIGSANMDARSMIFDYEVNSFIFSPATTKQLQAIFVHDLEKCTLLTKDGYKKRFNAWHRFVGRIFGAFKGFF